MLGEPCYHKASHRQSRLNNIGRVEGLVCICNALSCSSYSSEFSEHGFRERVSMYLLECFATVDTKSAEANGNFCFPDLMYVHRDNAVAGRHAE
jgi:hypothetical protein